jgi:predicted RNA polymerase sigma factor
VFEARVAFFKNAIASRHSRTDLPRGIRPHRRHLDPDLRLLDLAEEALQEAFVSALPSWEKEGAPKNPGAWLTTVAHRKLLDAVRKEKTKTQKAPELRYEEENRLSESGSEAVTEENSD